MHAPSGSLAPSPDRAPDPPSLGHRARVDASAPARVAPGFADDDERARVLAWLDAGLRPGRARGLAHEYPLLWRRDGSAVPITVWSGALPRSFCLLWPVRFELPSGPLRVGLVSLVYTDPDARGRGLARRAIDAALAAARDRSLGLVLLWSDLDVFYADQGFTRAGLERLLTLDRAVVDRALDEGALDDRAIGEWATGERSIARATLSDADALATLRSRRSSGIRFDRDELAALLAIPALETLVARDDRGVVAFAMQGRGEDFDGVVHEWGGDPKGVLHCLSHWLRDRPSTAGLLLLAPPEREPLTWRLRAAGARVLEQPLAWMRLAAAPALATDLARLVPDFAARLTLVDADAARPARVARLRGPVGAGGRGGAVGSVDSIGDAGIELTQAELLALLFGPASDPRHTALRERIRAVVPREALEALPLPFFVWGLESI